MNPWFTNDAVVFGILICTLAVIFYTSNSEAPFWKKFYTYVPALLLCYFIPALMNWPLGLISGEESNLYKIASRYFLPASLILLSPFHRSSEEASMTPGNNQVVAIKAIGPPRITPIVAVKNMINALGPNPRMAFGTAIGPVTTCGPSVSGLW